MKKIIAMLLALTCVMGLVACGEKAPATETESAAVNVPASALEVLTNIWNGVPEDNRFFAMGGDMSNPVDNAPGNYSLEDEGLTSTLLIPAEQVANVTEAASLVHGMMLNNFTCGVFHMAEGADAAAFAQTMRDAIANNQWICGMPEKMIVAIIGGEYVLACFGINDAVNPFETSLGTADADAEVKFNESLAR